MAEGRAPRAPQLAALRAVSTAVALAAFEPEGEEEETCVRIAEGDALVHNDLCSEVFT